MTAISDARRRALPLVDIIDLKWLFAGEGVHLHVERLQNDPAYVAEMLARAERSPSEALRLAARRLADKLGQAPAAPG